MSTVTPATPVAPARAPGLVARWRDDRWRRRVQYPVAGQPYRTSSDIDLLRGMRQMMRLLGVMVLVLVAMFAVVITGHALPNNFHLYVIVPAVWGSFAFNPHLRSILLWQIRPKKAEAWTDAGVRFADLGLIGRSPLTPTQVHDYTNALGAVPETGVDVRLVWALHERGITPEVLDAYISPVAAAFGEEKNPLRLWGKTTHTDRARTPVPTVQEVVTIAERYTPDDWLRLRLANPHADTYVLMRAVAWLRHSRATLTPDQFPVAETLPPRSVADATDVLAAWTPVLPFGARFEERKPCPRNDIPPKQGCPTCGASPRTGHTTYLLHPADTLAQTRASDGERARTLREWTDACGLLAPHFIAGGFGFDVAQRMCTQPDPPTVDTIRTLAALRTDPL